MLTDLGSSNGTRVDDDRVTGETPLAPGVNLVFGEISLVFEPRDTGIRKGGGTVVLQIPLPTAPPPAPGPLGVVLGGGRRTVVRSTAWKPLVVGLVLLGALLLVGSFLLG
jgi:pSer/pThr/pTyr-binding forkhead associated (FHA) protein